MKMSRTRNFWKNQLDAKNVTLHEMAELLSCSYKYTVAYFTGFVHPTDDTIADICSLLDVPVDLGKRKFDEIYDAWGKAHKDTYVKYSNTYKRISKYSADATDSTKTVLMNFWKHKISSNGISYYDLADKLNVPSVIICSYFNGSTMPDEQFIKDLCIMFDVDYDRGYQAFLKAHDSYRLTHESDVVKKTKEISTPADIVEDITIKEVITPAPIVTKELPTVSDLQMKLYGELSYEDFIKVISLTTADAVLEFVYGKVDFDVFNSLR